ncbi:MAG: Esterase [Actinomycetia bacterium]|nr:Esterase [Actinomycetes bacterium]
MRYFSKIFGVVVIAGASLVALPTAVGATQTKPAHDVYAFGDAGFFGSTGEMSLNSPLVGMANTKTGKGYWMLGEDGGVFSYGNAKFYGSTGNIHLAQPVVGMAATPSGKGYWFVAADGGIFSYGDARFYGSTGNMTLTKPVVAMGATPSGHGYWLVASDGGMFAFGDAVFRGSTGNIALHQPIVGMAATRSGKGYWLAARDGGIFAFGDTRFFGSTGGTTLAQPITGVTATRAGDGYWLVARDGGIFAFGHARFYGSMGGVSLDGKTVVGMVRTPTGRGYWVVASGTRDSGVASELAQQLLSNDRVVKTAPAVLEDLEHAARSEPATSGYPLDRTILRMLVRLARDHSYSISALESGGSGHSRSSRHYTGHAADINILDYQQVTGRNPPAITIINTVAPLMPPGSRFGQSNCGATPALPIGVTTIADGCNHLHIDVP